MKEKKLTQTATLAELRRLAEARLGASEETAPPAGTGEESLRLLHELQVHQIELEMQNQELRKARDEKEAALEKYTDLYDFAPVGYFTLNRKGVIRSVNLTGTGFIGIDRSQLIGRHFGHFVAGKDRPAFTGFIEKAFASLDKEACELELMTEGNSLRIAQIEALADASGEECRIALIDITERKRAEDERLRLAALVEYSEDAIIAKDLNGNILSWNKSSERLFGYRSDEVMGKPITLLIPPELQEEEDRILQGLLAGKRVETFESALITRNRRRVKVSVTSSPIIDSQGCLIGTSKIVRDITERVRAEELRQVRIILLEYAAGHSLEELLRKTLDEVGRLLDSTIGFYHFVESDQKTLSLQAWSTSTIERFCKAEGNGLHYRLDKAGVWVDCVRQRKPVIHNDYASLPHRKGLPEGHAAVIRELVVPILRNDLIVAILGIGNKPCDYTPEDVEVVSLLADLSWEIIVRKIAEEKLLKSEERYRSLVNITSQIIWTTNAAGEVVDDLASLQAFSGLSREEVRGSGWTNAIHPDDIERTIATWKHAVETGSDYNVEFRMRRHDGEYRYISTRGMPVMGKDGNIREWVGTCTDFTELFESAKQIIDSEFRYRRLFESAKDGILILDADTGKVVDANPFLLQLLGYSYDALYGKYIWEIGLFKDIAASRDAFKTLQDNEYIRYDDLPLETLDGRSIAVEFVSNAYQVDHGKVIQCNIRDISEHKKLEQQFRQAQKMEAIGTLAGGIAHDFNNILTAIVGYGYLAQMTMGPDDPQRQNIENMLAGADRAAHLTRDLLIFSRKQVSEKSPVDLNEIVSIVEKFLERIIGEDIVCKIALHGEPLVVYADTHQLEQVLMNLATNARDAMQGGGNLTISSETITLGNDFVSIHGYGKPGRYALLTVSDTGSGMDKDTCKKIFEPFFTTKEVGKGTGLGLAVTYGIIKQHEGFINVYSEPGIGTTFKIYLPLITSEVREAEVAQKREILSKGTETILLVEDDASTRELISIILNNEGYTVIEAVDGKDAVKKFVENRETIQLLLSDLIMPRMNGKEAYDEMKAWRPELKAVFVSGYAPDDIRQKMSLDSGAALISKPITPYTLLKKVRSLLDEGDKLG